MSKRNTGILIGVLALLAAATAVAFVLLFSAKSDIEDLKSNVGDVQSSSKSQESKNLSDLEGLRERITRVEEEAKTGESAAKKAKAEFDPDKPFLEGDVSVNAMLKTIDLNAETANDNIDKIEGEVSRLKGQLKEEKQVSGD